MNNAVLDTSFSLASIAPLVIVAISIVLVMMSIALKRSYKLSFLLSVAGLTTTLLAIVLMLFGAVSFEPKVGTLLWMDGFALFNSAVIVASALVCTCFGYTYFQNLAEEKEELHLLVLTATLGAMILTASEHFLSFFMGLELLSVPMYGMLAYTFLKQQSLESGIKYLVLSAAASATLLMGMALVFVDAGTLQFSLIKEQVLFIGGVRAVMVAGFVLMIAAIAFKLSLAPFHAWVGDVYQGAVPPVAAYLASASKVAAAAILVRFCVGMAAPSWAAIDGVLVLLVVLSVLAGNLLALRQTSIKRMIAYSSIAHMGYVLMVLIAQGSASDTIITTYMLVYALTSLGVFGVLTLMTGCVNKEEADTIASYQGLFWRRPILTAVLTIMLLSLAGIPTTAGFMTKMQVMFAVVEGGRFGLALMLVLGSAIGLYYYLRMILIMYKRPMERVDFDVSQQWRTKISGVLVIAIMAIVVLWGLLPSLMLDLTAWAMLG